MNLLITEQIYDIAIPLNIDKDLAKLEHEPLARVYHAYLNTWVPLTGERLKSKRKPTRMQFLSYEQVQWEKMHIPKDISKSVSMFLTKQRLGKE